MCKDWKKKLPVDEVRNVEAGMKKLRSMIEQLEGQGTPFEKIFNNDVIKYDILGNNFFVFKHHGKANSQVRILYRFVRNPDKSFDLEIHQVYIKRKDLGKLQNAYLKDFEKYVKNYTDKVNG